MRKYTDKERRAARLVSQVKYRAKNREKMREQNKRYREKHPEKRAEYQKRYRKEVTQYAIKWQAEWRKNNPSAYLCTKARARAKELNLPFDLEPSDIVIPFLCPLLCMILIPNVGKKKHAPNSPSLDRKDPQKGYVKGNVWIISHQANVMKNSATPEQLQLFARNVLEILK